MAEPASQPPVAERRLCSVLFADLVGFTPLSETRDAEAVRELLSGYFDVARTVITRYGGVVEKFIGDAVMAVWGVPQAHEDDAERCVRAALELVASLADYGESHGAAGLAARAGVVTGEVAVTLGATGQGMVAGDAVNTAARVQAEAEAGSVLVDDVTRQATSAAISYLDAGPHALKGKADAVRLWRPTRVVAAVGGSERVDGLEASFLGRDVEFRRIKDAFHETVEQGKARLVAVVGAAGVGKSRLRWEFFKYSDGLALQFYYHAGRCLPYGDGVAYWALAEMVRQRLGIAEEEPTEGIRQKLDDGLARWVTDEADRQFLRPRLGALLGVADPGLGRDELFAGWRLWFERLADEQPVTLVIEDLQWADPGLLDFLEQLLDWSADQPIFVLTLSRPELFERRPTWGSGRRNAMTVSLDGLSASVMTQLLHELVPGVPDVVADQIVDRADGIPLYAVELVRSLIDRDLVQPIDGVYRLVGTVDTLDVPASLSSLVAARIDALPADERTFVQGLAVLGGSFPRAAAAAVTDLDAEAIDSLLTDLVRREILRVRTDRGSPDRGQYTFTQTLLRQVAYDTLSRRDRKSRHMAVADHLRATFPDDGAELTEVIAQHYLDAYEAIPDDPDAPELRRLAATAFARAGHRALSVGAPDTAERAFSTAAELTTEAVDRRDLVESAAMAAFQADRYETALARFEAAAAEYVAAGDEREAARVARWIGDTLRLMGRMDEAILRLRQALDVLERGEADAALAEVHTALATSLLFTGQTTEALPHVEVALQVAEALRLPDVLSMAAIRRAHLLSLVNRPQEALVDYEWAVGLAERHGLGLQARMAYVNASDLSLNDDLPGTVEHCQAAMEWSRRRGERQYEAIAVANVAALSLLTGRWAEAERLCREMISGSGRPGDEFLYARLGWLHALRGDIDRAEAELAQIAAFAESEDMQSRTLYAATRASIALAAGDLTQALDIAGPVAHEVSEALALRNDMFRQVWPDALDAALALGALDQADELIALVAHRPVGHVPPYLGAQLAHYQARVAAARGQHEQAEARFTSAAEGLRELGYPYWLALVELDHATWLVEQDRAEEAAPQLSHAIETLDMLDARPALRSAQNLLRAVSPPVAATIVGQRTASPADESELPTG